MGLVAAATTARGMAATVRVLGRGELSRYGSTGASEVTRLESELQDVIGVRHALAVNSGTSALVAALIGAGIGPGDEVLVPAYTWVSTAAAPLAVGAVPVLVEVDRSLTMDPADLARKITPQSRAVIPVHMQNLVCDMDPIMSLAATHGLTVIEDTCQAVGLRYRGRRVGSIGHAGCFSFNQYKNIRSGEGGALLTDDDTLFERAAMYHDVGSFTRPGFATDDSNLIVGVNLRMPELSAAVLRPQLDTLDTQLRRRRRHHRIMLDTLPSGPGAPRPVPHHDPAWAAGLAVTFDGPDGEADAVAFAARRGVRRLSDTGRHVYTNWRSIRARNPVHPRADPYREAAREIDYGPDACPATLDILARTCVVDLSPEMPTPAFRLLAARNRATSPRRARRRAVSGVAAQ